MDIQWVVACKAIISFMVAYPLFAQAISAGSALRLAMARSLHPFVSGRGRDRWEFPSRAACALFPIVLLASAVAPVVWIYYLPPYAPPMSAEEHRVLALGIAMLGSVLLVVVWLLTMYYSRIEFTPSGIRCASPKRFLRGQMPWCDRPSCSYDANTDIITISSPSETITLPAEAASFFGEAASRFGRDDHPITVALHRVAESRSSSRPRR